ncbi:MAG: histidine phosphatase family protein [Acutalibacteraceae bacterium]|nr:histidine phosphatase family protein [Acutalibacteraceae bacterium]
MTQIYLVRHCEAMGNKMRIFQGTTDCDISETGEKQLEFLSERFAHVHIDKVYSSPLIRTVKTARAIIGKRELEVITHKGLIELDGGVVEGRPFAEAFNEIEGLAEIWNNHPQDFAPDGGEPMRVAYERIWNTILELARENEGKSVAVATHGGVSRCLCCRMLYNDINRLSEVPWCENTAVTKLCFDDDMNVTMEYMNDHTHVPDEYMPKRSRIVSKVEENKQ